VRGTWTCPTKASTSAQSEREERKFLKRDTMRVSEMGGVLGVPY